MADRQHSTSYTQSVNELNSAIYSPDSQVQSLYQQAKDYFVTAEQEKNTRGQLEAQLEQNRRELLTASTKKKVELNKQHSSLSQRLKNVKIEQDQKRLLRLDSAIKVCMKILSITESDNFEDTQLRSAKFLGTLLLLSPGYGKKLSELHRRCKPAYKAVLSLRILDKLVNDGDIKQTYILEYYDAECRYGMADNSNSTYIQAVILPIMLAAIFQDIGFQHPDLINLHKGDGSLDEFRILEPEERKIELKLCYKHAVDYVINGLGCQAYSGSSKSERDHFNHIEKQRLQFQLGLLKDAVTPKLGIGDIIKIPQIYTSVVLSTKRRYIRKDLPKAVKFIEQLAQKKSINQKVATAFISIVGYFPQGYGVTFIPKDLRGVELDSYEYGIVSRLNPPQIDEPICRVVTRNLGYISSGSTGSIKKDCNLHFGLARNKLKKVDKARLIEIMQNLSESFKPEDVENLIPALWEPYEYFSIKKNQNLWNKSV